MSRFTGWTETEVNKLLQKQNKQVTGKITVPKMTPIKYEHISKIMTALNVLGINAFTEYKFHEKRKFRFDIAVRDEKIAIEYEGGTYTNGRHIRGKGYARDCEKYNLAVMNGWSVLRYTVDITKSPAWEYKIAADVQRLIKLRGLKS